MDRLSISAIALSVIWILFPHGGYSSEASSFGSRSLQLTNADNKSLEREDDQNDNHSEVLVNLALDIFKRQHLHRAAIFSCSSNADRQLVRKMTAQFPTVIVTPTTLWRLERPTFQIGIFVALDACPMGIALLDDGAIQPFVNSSYRWLFASPNWGEETFSSFRAIKFRFDTSITVAFPEGNAYKLMDVYYDTLRLMTQTLGIGEFTAGRSTNEKQPQYQMINWVDAENSPSRSKINGIMHVGIVVHDLNDWGPNDSIPERFSLSRDDPKLPAMYFAMTGYHEFNVIADLFNITLHHVLFSQSGLPNKYGVFTDILGALQVGKIEVSTAKLSPFNYRRVAVDVIGTGCEPYNYGVIYYVGNSQDALDALFYPFSAGLWAMVGGTLCIGGFLLFIIGKYEMRVDKVEGNDVGIFTALLIMLGAFTDQCHPMDLRWYASRTLYLVFLISGFLILSAYSAFIIQSLLSAPAPSIRNRNDYMHSPLTMAVEDFYHFPKNYFGPTMDSDAKELFEKKVKPPIGGGFLSIPKAFKGVYKEKWALMGQTNSIKLEIETTATPQQICRLKWINDLYYATKICRFIKNKSQVKSLLGRGMSLIHERGLLNRERMKHYAGDSICLSEFQRQWAPTKLQLVMSAIGILLLGAIVGSMLCLFEAVAAPLLSKTKGFNFERNIQAHNEHFKESTEKKRETLLARFIRKRPRFTGATLDDVRIPGKTINQFDYWNNQRDSARTLILIE